jgi:hypothetical protein
MAKAKFESKSLGATATRPLYAYVGATDLAVEIVRDYVSEFQKLVAGVQKDVTSREPQALRDQATKVVSARVDALSKDAKARRTAIEKRVAELQTEAGDTLDDLIKRGESLVGRIRRQQSTQDTVTTAKTTVAKAKTTNTQAAKSRATKKTTTKKAAAAKKTATRSSAKATVTSAKKTATNATKAATKATAKVGD